MIEFGAWFEEDELERCPTCGARRLVPAEPQQQIRICLDCGIVEVAAGTDSNARATPSESASGA
jgi:hypothetical protein